jgi:hypothetical protein
MRLPIDSDVLIPVWISTESTDVWMGSISIPLATDNRYITTRYTDGNFYDCLPQWDEHMFKPIDTCSPQPGYTSQTILGIAISDGTHNHTGFHPCSTAIKIAEYRMRTPNNPALIGQTVDVFSAGYDRPTGLIYFGDTLGALNFINITQEFYPVTFVGVCADSNLAGTGVGVLGYPQNHIDTYCFGPNDIRLRDITRRQNYTQHGHNGGMQSDGQIITYGFRQTIPQFVEMSDLDNYWIDSLQRPGVDAHVYTGWVYDFMWEFLGRNCHTNVGLGMPSWVNVPIVHNKASYYNGVATFGTVDTTFYSLAGCPDVVAHEWGHGINAYTSNLVYSKESGALKESFADMFAATFNYRHLNEQTDWWKIGKNFYRNDPQRVCTDMQYPNNTHQAETYEIGEWWYDLTNCDTPDTLNDYCGVRANSGVPNKMFYLLAAGGTHNGVAVQGIGVENAFNVMYRANNDHWNDSTDFYHARWGSIGAAIELDVTKNYAYQTAYAWGAVGLCDSCDYIPGDANGNGYRTGSDVTRLVTYLKGIPTTIPDSCHSPYAINSVGDLWLKVTCDFNGDCRVTGADATALVRYFKGFGEVRWCPYFTPSPDYRRY